MNYIDLVIAVIVLWGFWTGIQRGLIRSVSSLLGWVLALVLASRYVPMLAPSMSVLTHDPVVRKIAAFVVIVLAVLIVSALIGNVMRSVLKAMYLGLPERLAGGAFGTAKGLLIVMILIQVLKPWVAESPYWQNSKAVEWLAPYAPMVVEFSKKLATDTWQQVKAHDDDQNREVSIDHADGEDVAVPNQQSEREHAKHGHSVSNPFL
jgi:membrane protein required for colicin V production